MERDGSAGNGRVIGAEITGAARTPREAALLKELKEKERAGFKPRVMRFVPGEVRVRRYSPNGNK